MKQAFAVLTNHRLMVKILGVFALIACIAAFLFYRDNPLVTRVIIGTNTFTVDLAITPQEITDGLGGRTAMAADRGMLFVFPVKNQYTFWMKGMQFPLDFIWITDNTVVDITQDVPVVTQGQYPTYIPKTPVNKVLEINAGEAARRNIKIGDTVILKS